MTQTAERLIRVNEVSAMTGLPVSSIYEAVSKGAFPRNVSIGLRSKAWIASEVAEWIAARIKDARRKA